MATPRRHATEALSGEHFSGVMFWYDATKLRVAHGRASQESQPEAGASHTDMNRRDARSMPLKVASAKRMCVMASAMLHG